jgi:hypothetical protein
MRVITISYLLPLARRYEKSYAIQTKNHGVIAIITRKSSEWKLGQDFWEKKNPGW